MLAQFGARLAAVRSVVEKLSGIRSQTLAGLTAAALALAGCMPATVPLVGADPSNPAAKVAAVGYRPTVAPYTRFRPTTPETGRKHNEPAAPSPKSGQ